MKKKVCKKCKIFVKESTCPECGGNQFSELWKGRVMIFKPEESEVAKKLNVKKPGNYAIKIR